MGWSGWKFIGGPPPGAASAPAVISRNRDVVNLYLLAAADDALWQKAYFDGRRRDWQRFDDGFALASRPAAASMRADHEHIFVRGADDQVWQKWWTADGGWGDWTPHGAPPGGFIGAPCTVSRNSDVANIYVRGTDNALWQKAYSSGSWDDWERHGGGVELASDIAAASMRTDHEHVFALASDGQIWQKWWTPLPAGAGGRPKAGQL